MISYPVLLVQAIFLNTTDMNGMYQGILTRSFCSALWPSRACARTRNGTHHTSGVLCYTCAVMECCRRASQVGLRWSRNREQLLLHRPRDAQRAVPSAEVASQARSILSLCSDPLSELAL